MKSADIVIGDTYVVKEDAYRGERPAVAKRVGAFATGGRGRLQAGVEVTFTEGRGETSIVRPAAVLRPYTQAEADARAEAAARAARAEAAADRLEEILGMDMRVTHRDEVDVRRPMSVEDAEALIARLTA